MGKDLKAIAKEVGSDIMEMTAWFSKEVSYVIDGSHKSGARTYNHICETLDTSKEYYGKRCSNLIAYVCSKSIQDIYDTNLSQALTVWKYLSDKEKDMFNKIVMDLLENLEDELKGEMSC